MPVSRRRRELVSDRVIDNRVCTGQVWQAPAGPHRPQAGPARWATMSGAARRPANRRRSASIAWSSAAAVRAGRHDAPRCCAPGVGGDVTAAMRPAVAIPYRRGDRAQSLLELLVHGSAEPCERIGPAPPAAGPGRLSRAGSAAPAWSTPDTGPASPTGCRPAGPGPSRWRRRGTRVPTLIATVMMRRVGTCATETTSSPSSWALTTTAHLLHQLLQVRHRDLRQRQAGQVGVAEPRIFVRSETGCPPAACTEDRSACAGNAGRRRGQVGPHRDLAAGGAWVAPSKARITEQPRSSDWNEVSVANAVRELDSDRE